MAAAYGHAERIPQSFCEIPRQEAEFRWPGLRVGDYLHGVLQELLPGVELDDRAVDMADDPRASDPPGRASLGP